jgi:PAS domain S-box-containing protein
VKPELSLPVAESATAVTALRFGDLKRTRTLRRISRGCSFATAVLALGALAGFWFEIHTLASLSGQNATMKPTTAIAALALCFAIYRLASPSQSLLGAWAPRIALLVALLLSGATLGERAFDWDLGIDELFLRDPWPVAGSAPGRPAAATTAAIAMLATALLLAGRGLLYTAAQALAIAAGSIGGLALIGYIFGAAALYAFQSYSQVSPTSALSLVLLSIGTLAAMPDRGLASLASASSLGGALTRRLVPVAFGVPLALAVLAQLATQRGLVRSELAMALFFVTSTATLSAVILHTANSIHRLDAIRSRSEALLRESAGRVRHLSALVNATSVAIISFDGLGRVATWNSSAERVFGRRAADTIGRHASEVLALGRDPALPAAIEQVLRRPEERRIEVRFESPRGDTVTGFVTLSPLLDGERRPLGACAIFEATRAS